jgi:hypothetical protein
MLENNEGYLFSRDKNWAKLIYGLLIFSLFDEQAHFTKQNEEFFVI